MRSNWVYFTNALAVIAILSMLLVTCNNKRDIKIKKGYKLVWNDEFNYAGLPDSSNGTTIQLETVGDGEIMNSNFILLKEMKIPGFLMALLS